MPTHDIAPRVIAYVDGFNLYHGLMDKEWGRYRWLDVRSLLAAFVRPPQRLVAVRYFTALNSHPPDRYQRHKTYLEALRRACDVEIVVGKIQPIRSTCGECGAKRTRYQEKQTDVAIAVDMILAAATQNADEIFLMSGDSDLAPAVAQCEHLGVPVTIIDPPARHSDELAAVASKRLRLNRSRVSQAQMPDPVTYMHRGRERRIHRPASWLGEPASEESK